MMAERGLSLAHTTVLRWVQHYLPEFQKRWYRLRKDLGTSWRVDDTYIKVRGEWTYLYRAVDKQGRTVDFYLSKTRGIAAAKAVFRKALSTNPTCRARKVTLDGQVPSHRALRLLRRKNTAWRLVNIKVLQVPQQCCRAGPSRDQGAVCVHVGL